MAQCAAAFLHEKPLFDNRSPTLGRAVYRARRFGQYLQLANRLKGKLPHHIKPSLPRWC
jgi:hypothetical protein